MTYATTLDAPPRGQFEAPYRGSCWDNEANVYIDERSYDCGPTGAAFIDGCYNSRRLKIGYVRSLGAPECVGTSAPQVTQMLTALGIPTDQLPGPNITSIRNIVAGRRRPVLVAVKMGNIPQSYSQDTFTLNHWLVICATSKDAYGNTGVWEMDSNAPASTGAFHFIPDWALQNALLWDVPLVVPRWSMPAPVTLPDTSTEDDMALAWVNDITPHAIVQVTLPKGQPVRTDPHLTAANVAFTTTADTKVTIVGQVNGDTYLGSKVWFVYVLNAGGLRVFNSHQL